MHKRILLYRLLYRAFWRRVCRLGSCLAVLVLLLGIALIATAPARAAGPRTLLVLGDSISAGYGLPSGSGWVKLLSDRIAAKKLPWQVVNASISGDTTAGGLARLPALLAREHPALVVIEQGGNDGLRGNDLAVMQTNLEAMVQAARSAGAHVLIIGMRLPPNYGNVYTSHFEAVFHDVAKKFGVPLVPFFFNGFAERIELFQADRIHPTVAAQPLLLDNVWPTLAPLLSAKP
jgi:acyl-CoA thioesterase-1